MSFKTNLLKKIQIDNLTDTVLKSMGPPDSGKKIDARAMRRILEMSPYENIKERDLDLYIQRTNQDKPRILVLGNEMALFQTDMEDVAMRRSPTLKEMLSIRNAIKILNDKDIVISKGVETIKSIQDECIRLLDLTYTESDLEELEQDGIAALEKGYIDGVLEILALFAELLGYRPPAKKLQLTHFSIWGAFREKESRDVKFGPLVVYSMMHNELKYIDERISIYDSGAGERLHHLVIAEQKALAQGPAVFKLLKQNVIQKNLKGDTEHDP